MNAEDVNVNAEEMNSGRSVSEAALRKLRCVLVHTWLTTQRCLAGSFDTIWQFQNITTSDSESL